MIFRIFLFGWLCLAASGAVAATLTNERIKVTISDRDGSVIGLEASDGGKIFRRIGERRRLETADRQKNWDESLDEVLSSEAPEAGVLRLECRNPAAAEIDRIVKIYTLRPGDDFVSREIRIMPCGQAFIEVRTEAVLDSAFRRNGFYTAPFPVCAAPLPAGEVADPRPLFSTVYLLLSAAAAEMYNPADNQSAATWLIERNGRYCYWGFFIPDEKEVARQTILATPEGWEHLTNRDALRPGRENRWTVRYSLLEGDSSLLLRRMLESEPRRMMTDVSGVPDWLTRVKLMMFLVQADHRFSPETVAIWKRIAELPGPPGFLMPMFDLWGHQGGDCPTGTEEAKRAIEMAALTKWEIPQARVGTYTILLADQASELMQRLPEIAVKDRQGGYPMADFPGRRMMQLHNPRAVDYFVDNWSRLMEETGWYLYAAAALLMLAVIAFFLRKRRKLWSRVALLAISAAAALAYFTGYQALVQAVEKNIGKTAAVFGLTEGARTVLAGALSQGRRTLVVTPSDQAALRMAEDLSRSGVSALHFPARELTFYHMAAESRELVHRRIAVNWRQGRDRQAGSVRPLQGKV